MVITAHPDDAEYSFGGTVARLADAGTEVVYVVCTDGSQGGEDPSVSDADLTRRRYAEQQDAADLLGATEVVFLGLRDGSLTPDVPLRRALTREIRRHRPELVLTHQPLRSLVFPIGASHPDHLATGEAALAAVYPDARNPRAYPELLSEGLTPHRVQEVWIPGHEHTDFYVDVSPYLTRRIEAIQRHKSQFADDVDPTAALAWVVNRLSGNGQVAGCRYAESYRRIITEAAAGAEAVTAEAAP
ncbi:PIG-L deacetylase family protein [Polymorphospora lycopeni]|uniref:PIG-L deacetylase family protein n=1 Tax=Polymorphospora lycopeni TaxID=3140240 RepID=A0ABV5CZC7_9ACTN